MARVLKHVEYHNCQIELHSVDKPDLHLGSIAECSCGKQFIKCGDTRGETYWHILPEAEYLRPDGNK